MVVLDLEWNQGYGRHELEEIIQLGAVQLTELGGTITNTFNAYIRPTLYKTLSVGARHLPDLLLSLSSETEFSTAYRDFVEWCGGETVFAAWGHQDISVLQKNVAYRNEEPFTIGEYIDLQAVFDRTVGADRHLSLETAVTYCGIPETFSFHNALNDAMYAALVSGYVDPNALHEVLAPRKRNNRRGQKLHAVPKKSGGRRIYFASTAAEKLPEPTALAFQRKTQALNNLKLRSISCPECGEKYALSHWYTLDRSTYYGTICCPEHGAFLCRLVLMDEAGKWRAERAFLPTTTEGHIVAFEEARRAEVYCCRRTCKQKKKRRWFAYNHPGK